MSPIKFAISVSLAVSVLMIIGKGMAWWLTHSAAILADAVESLVHWTATAMAAFSLWYASRPADSDHPYGHGRIAYFSAGFEGALVCAASIAVLWSGVIGLIRGTQIHNFSLGMLIAGGLAVINLVLGTYLVRLGKRENTLIVTANGRHVLADVWTTAAAILGVSLVKVTGVGWFDPAAAIVLGVWILVSGLSLLRGSFSGLMDKIDPETTERIADTLRAHGDYHDLVDFHALRCREINNELFVDVHMLMPGRMRVDEAHARVTELENAVRDAFPRLKVHVNTHMEPAEAEKRSASHARS